MAEQPTLDRAAQQLQRLYRLPPMPAVALHILRLTNSPDATVGDLTRLIERDPSLSAQVLRYARSALFNYRGSIDSLEDAITRVLGFDRVGHLAMGLAAGRAFEVPAAGPLGLDAFWRHSLHCAYLTQAIIEKLPPAGPLNPSLGYLCGLLHNFGLLLVAHLFPAQFATLNQLRAAEPQATMAELEQRVFDQPGENPELALGHGALGAVLARLWHLPEAVVKVAGMHQYGDYRGSEAAYVLAVQLANGLLKQRGIGDEFDDQELSPLLARLGLDAAALAEVNARAEAATHELDALAGSLAA